jgi:hypothetical protein
MKARAISNITELSQYECSTGTHLGVYPWWSMDDTSILNVVVQHVIHALDEYLHARKVLDPAQMNVSDVHLHNMLRIDSICPM